MKVNTDRAACMGHAQCWAVAPDVYELDDSGFCVTTDLLVPVELEADARHGAAACPESAIAVTET